MSYNSLTISSAMRQIRDGQLLLPAIQRDFVWSSDRIYLFLDSLMRGYPVGTLLFWNTRQRVQYRAFESSWTDTIRHTFRVKPNGQPGTLVLDGQQRLQSLYLALEGERDRARLFFDVLSGSSGRNGAEELHGFEFLTDEAAAKRNQESDTEGYWVPLSEIYGCQGIPQRRHLVGRYSEAAGIDDSARIAVIDINVDTAFSKLKAEPVLNHYTIDQNYGDDAAVTPINEILEIFVRINSGGEVLSKSDLMFSLMQLGWEGASDSIDDLIEDLNSKGRFDFSKDFVLRCALVCCGRGARYSVDRLREGETIEQIEKEFPTIATALRSTVDFLVEHARILDGRVLGSYNSLVPFTYYFYLNGGKRPRGEENSQSIKHAMYLALLSSAFSRHADSRTNGVTRYTLMPAHAADPGEFPLDGFREFIRQRTGHDRIDNALLQRNPMLLMNILERGVLLPIGKRRHRPEVDHIFPQKGLRDRGYSRQMMDDFANLRLVSKEDNIWKRDQDPGTYFAQHPGTMGDYLIPEELLDYDAYEGFLRARRKRIWRSVQDFLGIPDELVPQDDRLAPGEENAALDAFEKRFRTLLDTVLLEAVGADYWARVVPSGLAERVDRHVAAALKREPGKTEADFAAGRARLPLCDLGGYESIVSKKANWPYFEHVFRSREDFLRHMTAVRELRNAVKHLREPSLVERLNGEAGLVWLGDSIDAAIGNDGAARASNPAAMDLADGEDDVPTIDDYVRLLTRRGVPRGQQQLYRELYAAGDVGVSPDDLVAQMPRRDRKDLGGVIGAFGTRINYTPGYCKRTKPGIGFALEWFQPIGDDADADPRYRLRPLMREALKKLDPEWLGSGGSAE